MNDPDPHNPARGDRGDDCASSDAVPDPVRDPGRGAARDPGRPYHVLFLCTGNSARSILAEALLNTLGQGRFQAFSAGSYPVGRVHPLAIELCQAMGYDTARLRSKSWDEFATPGAPPLDLIITVCDNAAGEVCPLWPGRPLAAHWGFPDPAAVQGSEAERRQAFASVCNAIHHRIETFLSLPHAALAHGALEIEDRERTAHPLTAPP